MPLFLEICIAIVTLAFSTGAVFAGLGYFKQGGKQESMDNDSIYKNRIEALELQGRNQTSDIEKLTKEVKELHEAIDLRDKKFAEAILVLQGKDPLMSDFVKAGYDYMTLSKPVMEDLRDYLKKQII